VEKGLKKVCRRRGIACGGSLRKKKVPNHERERTRSFSGRKGDGGDRSQLVGKSLSRGLGKGTRTLVKHWERQTGKEPKPRHPTNWKDSRLWRKKERQKRGSDS